MDDLQRLEQLIRARHCCVSIVTYEESDAVELVRRAAERQNKSMWVWSVNRGVRDGHRDDGMPVSETEHPAAALYYLGVRENNSICVMLDLAEHLKDARTLRMLREMIDLFAQGGGMLVLIDHQDHLPAVVSGCSTRFELSLPDEAELERILLETLREFHKENPIKIDITRHALKTVIRNLQGLSARQAQQIIIDTVSEDLCFNSDDINRILAGKRQVIHSGGLLEYIETPVDLKQIGGLRRLKRWLKSRQDATGEEAAAFGIDTPRGVLMLGVQGAGKSLCAKAIATAWHRPLLRLDPGALYDRYIGESERRLRDALRQAERMAPIVLWIDEIEKGFASAASRSTDGGLSQRMFGSLLTWMQEHEAPVFLVATANDIEALPPELLRKGRFDEIFFVDLPDTTMRKEIFEIHLKKRKRDPEKFDLEQLAQVSEGYSGAEIEQGIVSGLHKVFGMKRELTTEDVIEALRESPPLSVTMGEAISSLRKWAKGKCVPAD
ncbi:MAG: AAA family ATPase [Phycisphaerae bacterium]|jgi:AAA+ superfamily predicted ATPase|nr:AAA family ATPase [Phycisphaerae bacterium]